MLIKHKHVTKDAAGADIEHELDIDIAEHVHNSKHRIKSDGEERELTMAELLERAPLADGAFRRMREAAKAQKSEAELRRQIGVLEQHLRTPEGAFQVLQRSLGAEGARAFIEQRMADYAAEDCMTPEQRIARERETAADRQLREREEKLARDTAAFEKRQKEQREAMAREIRERNAREWPGILEGAGVKATPYAMQMMAGIMRNALDSNFAMTPAQAAAEVAREIAAHVGAQGQRTETQRTEEVARLESQPGRTALPRSPGGQFVSPTAAQRPPPATLEEFRQRQIEEADRAYQKRIGNR